MAYKLLLEDESIDEILNKKLTTATGKVVTRGGKVIKEAPKKEAATQPSSTSSTVKATTSTLSPVPAQTTTVKPTVTQPVSKINSAGTVASMNNARASMIDKEKAIRGGTALGSMGLNTIGSLGKAVTTIGDTVKEQKALGDLRKTELADEVAERDRLMGQILVLTTKYNGNEKALANDADYQYATRKLASLNRVINAVENRAAQGVESSKADKAMNNILGLASDLRSTSLEGLSPTAQNIGNFAMGLGETAMLMPVAAVAPQTYAALMAGKIGGSTMYDKEQQGYTSTDALMRGAGSAAVTYGTSLLGLDKVVKGMTGKAFAEGGIKGGIENIAAQGLSEGLEGGLEYTADTYLDKLYGEDKKWSGAEFAKQSALEGLGGVIMGGALGGYSLGGIKPVENTTLSEAERNLKPLAEREADAYREFVEPVRQRVAEEKLNALKAQAKEVADGMSQIDENNLRQRLYVDNYADADSKRLDELTLEYLDDRKSLEAYVGRNDSRQHAYRDDIKNEQYTDWKQRLAEEKYSKEYAAYEAENDRYNAIKEKVANSLKAQGNKVSNVQARIDSLKPVSRDIAGKLTQQDINKIRQRMYMDRYTNIDEKILDMLVMAYYDDATTFRNYVGQNEDRQRAYMQDNSPKTMKHVDGASRVSFEEEIDEDWNFDAEAFTEFGYEQTEPVLKYVDKVRIDGKPVIPYEFVSEAHSRIMTDVNKVIDEVETYVKNYKGKGTELIPNGQGRYKNSYDTSDTEGYHRQSLNDPWYSKFYAENGRPPRKREAREIAEKLVMDDIRRGGGEYVDPEVAKVFNRIDDAKKTLEKLENPADIVGLSRNGDGVQVQYGEYIDKTMPEVRVRNSREQNFFIPGVESVRSETPRVKSAKYSGDTLPMMPGRPTAPVAPEFPVRTETGSIEDAWNESLGYYSPYPNTVAGATTPLQPKAVKPRRIKPKKSNVNTLAENVGDTTRKTASEPVQADVEKVSAYGTDTVGAAKYDPDSYRAKLDEANAKHGTLPAGENAVRLGELPVKLDDTNRKMSRFANTGVNAEITSDEFAKTIEREAAEGKFLYEVVHNKDLKEKAQASINKNGFDKSLEHWNYLIENNSKVTPEDMAVAQTLYNHANNYFAETGDKTAFNEARKLFADMQLVYTLNGKVTQTARMMRNTTPDGNLYVLEKLIDNINSKSKKHKVELNGELAQKLLNSKDVDEMVSNVEAIKDDIASQIYTSFSSLINEWRYFSMLANPRTHIRNIVGNVVMNGVYDIKDVVGAAAEGITSGALRVARGRGLEERSKAVLNKFSEKDKALIEFARTDYETNMADTVQGNGSKYSEKMDIASRTNVWTQNAVARKFSDITGGKSDAFGNLMNALTKGNMKALENADNRALKRNYTRALAEYMKANKHTAEFYNSAEGSVAFAKARDYATRQAKEATFHDDSKVADALGRLQESHALAEVAIGATVPFKKTPINIAKRAIEYSPVGLAKGGMDIAKGTGSVQAIDDIAKGITGTSLMVIGAWLASRGILNGVISGDDERERKLKLAQGHQDFAVEIGGKSITVESFAPSIIPMLMGASLYETMDSEDGIGLSAGDIADAFAAMNSPMVEMSVLSSVNDILDSIKYSDNKGGAIAGALAKNYASQFVPTLSGAVAKIADDTKRTTYIDKNSPYGKVGEDIIQGMKYKGVRSHKELEPSLDIWGREQYTGGLGQRAFDNLLNPTSVKNINETDVDAEISRLASLPDGSSVIPNKPDKYVDTKTGRVDYTASQYTDVVKGRNFTSYTDLAEMFEMPEYQALSDKDRISVIESLYEYNGINAKESVTAHKYNSNKDDKLDDVKKRGQFTTAEAILYKQTLSNIEESLGGNNMNGEVKKAQENYIESLDLTAKQKKVLEDNWVSDWAIIGDEADRTYTDGAGNLGDEAYILSGLSKSANKAWPKLKGKYSATQLKEFDELMVTKKADSEANFLNAGYSKSEFEKIWKAYH